MPHCNEGAMLYEEKRVGIHDIELTQIVRIS